MSLKVIILAAGKGTRMKSKLPKVLHKIANRPLIDYTMDLAYKITDLKPIVVVGYRSDLIKSHLGDKAQCVLQEEQLGTGHAVKCAMSKINPNDDILILFGDSPLLSYESCELLIKSYEGYDGAVLASICENPTGYGRVISNNNGEFIRIVEEKDATDDEKEIKLINAGVCLIKGNILFQYVEKIKSNNAQKEYYLPDILNLMKEDNHSVNVSLCPIDEILGVNSRAQLEVARKIIQNRILLSHMENGVTIINPETTYIDSYTEIDQDTIIFPNTYIINSKIESDCKIGPDSYIKDSKISKNVSCKYSYIEESCVDENTIIGPYSHLRPNSKVGKNVKIGNFVEIKNSELGNNTKASHLAYVGDAEVGSNVNVGCGVIFVNYDGVKKHKSIIRDGAFIGSNSNIVAPVLIDEKAYIACGSTVTNDVKANSLCVARSRQRVIENWVKKSKIFNNKGSK